jgi:hypothetical protein
MDYSFKVNSETFDCECCGFFTISDCYIKINKDKYLLTHDGHFGSGVWNGDEDTIPMHVIGLIHEADRVNIEDINFSWSLITSDKSIPPDNCSIDVLNDFYKKTKSVKLEIACLNGVYSFLVDDEIVFGHDVFSSLFLASDLELYEKEGYIENGDVWSTVCNYYIKELKC